MTYEVRIAKHWSGKTYNNCNCPKAPAQYEPSQDVRGDLTLPGSHSGSRLEDSKIESAAFGP